MSVVGHQTHGGIDPRRGSGETHFVGRGFGVTRLKTYNPPKKHA
jgi:hypothetical protein